MFFALSLIASFLTSTKAQIASIATQNCSLALFDRCGPAYQVPGTQSTCNATIAVTPYPAVYGVQCFQKLDVKAGLVFSNCIAAATDACNKLTDPHVKRDTWIWTNPAYIGCALGFWMPSGNGSDAAFAPDYNRCMDGIFTPMAKTCTNPSWNNVGIVNLQIVPNASTNGVAVDPYYPSYVISPSQLTPYATTSDLSP
ncbi:MAG: hypothetical protein Q9170_005807 [Blastenia crenularia]